MMGKLKLLAKMIVVFLAAMTISGLLSFFSAPSHGYYYDDTRGLKCGRQCCIEHPNYPPNCQDCCDPCCLPAGARAKQCLEVCYSMCINCPQ